MEAREAQRVQAWLDDFVGAVNAYLDTLTEMIEKSALAPAFRPSVIQAASNCPSLFPRAIVSKKPAMDCSPLRVL